MLNIPKKLRKGMGRQDESQRMNVRASHEEPVDDPAHETTVGQQVDKAREEALAEASQLWDAGHKVPSLELLRRTRTTLGQNSQTAYEYGSRAFLEGHTWAAREALHDAVDLDPLNLDALELFLDLNRDLPTAKGTATRAITALAEKLPHSQGLDSEAMAFLVPSVSLVDAVNKGIRKLVQSKDPVASQVSVLATSPKEKWEEYEQGVPQEVVVTARLTVALASGDFDSASILLEESGTEWIPQRALRQAIRQEIRRGNHDNARELLMYYRRTDDQEPPANQDPAASSRVASSAMEFSIRL